MRAPVDRETVFAAEKSGQVFGGKEIFFREHGDFYVFTVMAVNVFFDDGDRFIRGNIGLPAFPCGKNSLRIDPQNGLFNGAV